MPLTLGTAGSFLARNQNPLLAGIGLGANYFSGAPAAKAQKEAMRRQAQLIQQQNKVYQSVQPQYQALLAQGAQAAGLGQQQAPGQWGTLEDRMRLAAAQDQINRQAQQRQNQLQHTLAARGIATGSQAAALAQNQASAQRDLGNFQRQLVIQAPQEMERRRAQFANLLNPAFGQGAAASAGYGQQAQMYGGQANQAAGGIQDILAQYGYGRALAGQQQPYAGTDPFTDDENYQRWLAQQSGAWQQF